MQTVKPRARHIPSGRFCHMWELSHPDTSTKVWSSLPHDGAAYMLRKHVLPNQTDPVVHSQPQ